MARNCPICRASNEDDATKCFNCGWQFKSFKPQTAAPPSDASDVSLYPSSLDIPEVTAEPHLSLLSLFLNPAPQVKGTVEYREERFEPRPFDFLRPLVSLLLAVALFLTFLPVIVTLGAIYVVLSLLGLGVLGFLFVPILSLLLGAILRGGQRQEHQIPILNLQIADEISRKGRQVIMQGYRIGGEVQPGNEISAWGRWRNGALYAQRIRNDSTGGTNIRTRASRSRFFVIILLGYILYAFWYLSSVLKRF